MCVRQGRGVWGVCACVTGGYMYACVCDPAGSMCVRETLEGESVCVHAYVEIQGEVCVRKEPRKKAGGPCMRDLEG